MSTEADQNDQTDHSSGERKEYHFRGRSPSVKIESDQKGWMYTISNTGISAGALEIDGTNVSIEGSLYVNALKIVHKPNGGPFGTINIRTRDRN